MPPKTRQTAGAKKVRRKEKKNVAARRTRTSRARSTTPSCRSPTRTGAVIAWASAGPGRLQGLAQVDSVRRAAGRRDRRPPAHGARHEEGRRLRQGPGLGPRDRDPLAAGRRPRGRRDPDVTPQPAQRLPSAQAPPGLTTEREDPWLVTPAPTARDAAARRRSCSSRATKCESPKCPFEIRPYPPGQHGRGRTKESEYLLQLREKQKARASTACWRSSSAATTRRPTAAGQDR